MPGRTCLKIEPTQMNLHRRLYPSTEKQVLQHIDAQGRIHGSTVRDFFIEFAKGRFAVDDHAEKLLKELVEAGVIEVLYREPTHSQAAFAGLYHSSKSYQNTPWGPGTIEHYWYRKVPPQNSPDSP